MDYSILWTLGIIAIVISFIFGVLYLKRKGVVSESDIKTVADMLGLSLAILNELDLKQENEIKKIGEFVFIGLNSAIGLYSLEGNKDKIILLAKNLVFELCSKSGLEVTDNRRVIVEKLVELGLNNRYGEEMIK